MSNATGRGKSLRNWSAPVLGALLLLVALDACSVHRGGKVAHDKVAPVAVTPNAINKLPENINAVTVTITNGQLDASQVTLQQHGASVIHLVNKDATAYRFEITPNLVDPKAVPANATTDVSFTAPEAGNFTGQLLPQQGGSALTSLNVRIASAGGVNP